MSMFELVVFGALWLVLAALGTLVLVLYRQVEKAYAAADSIVNAGLAAGTEAPDLEVMSSEGVGPLAFPSDDELVALAFLTTSCEDCVEFVDMLRERNDFPGRVIGLVSGPDQGEISDEGVERFQALWVAHPPDIVRTWGIGTTPFAYVLRGRTIVASGSVRSRSDVEELLQQAAAFESQSAAETVSG